MSLEVPTASKIANGFPVNKATALSSNGVKRHPPQRRLNGQKDKMATPPERSPSTFERFPETTVCERDSDCSTAATRSNGDYYLHSNRTPPIQIFFRDSKTKLIMKLLFAKLCPSCENYCAMVEKELVRLGSTVDKELVYSISDNMVSSIVERNIISINLEDFAKQKWNVHTGNMYTEFTRVAYETFSDATNWGRVFVFLGFAVSFSIYMKERQMLSTVESILEWSCQVVEEDLAKYFIANGGWEGFAAFMETALRAARRNHEHHSDNTAVWSGAVAAGTLALGALAAFTLRNAFS